VVELTVEVGIELDVVLAQIDPDDSQDRGDEIIDVDESLFLRVLREHGPHARDDLAGAMPRAHDLTEGRARPLDIGPLCGEPAWRRTRLRHDAGQRLIDLVRD